MIAGMYFNELVAAYDQARRERNIFHDLMRFRIREVLLVASLYDSFVVESDGVLTEQIYGEYFKLNLNTVPRITCAYTEEEALDVFYEGRFDLVILMAGVDFEKPLALARQMKAVWPGTPVLLMATNNTSLATLDPTRAELAAIDRVFVWNGYSKLFVGMIKYVEDLRNVDADTRTGLVRVMLLIEDSVRYYSRYLPVLYKVVMRQTQALIEEERGVETYKLLRSRARPKVLLASSYEEATALFERYEPYMLTVITDLRFPRDGRPDPEAGFDFLKMAKSRIDDLPVMIQSSEPGVRERAYAMGAAFADKNSESVEYDLATFLQQNLGFGPFRFRNSSGVVVAEARNLDDFIDKLREVPLESVVLHAGHNHFSAWLMARGEIQFARLLRGYRVDDFGSYQDLRDFIFRVLDQARKDKSRGMIPYFDEAICRDENCMSRLGDGSVGGKGRGLVFIRSLLENLDFSQYLPGIAVKIPRTAFIGIDDFERFLETNGLWSFAFYEAIGPDGPARVRDRFLDSPLPADLVEKLRRYLDVIERPLAVRSSGLFEDMLMVPFSGIYDTYVIPNSHPVLDVRLRQLCDAIRLIYASLFSREARTYFEAARYNLEEERMAVVIQELVGERRGRWFYPHISGTAQSFNYYPVSYVKPEDGLCVAALGLGSYVVEGGTAHRFCPRYPKMDIVAPERAMASSQRSFRALDMERSEPDLRAGENAALADLDISEAESDQKFSLIASTWDLENDRLVPGIGARGPRFIDLANVLKNEALPFAQAVDMVLDVAARSMGVPVEIEYAFNLDESSGSPALYLLQIKPLIRSEDKVEVDIEGIDRTECLVVSERSMGNGRDSTLRDVIWVDPDRFDRSATLDIAGEIEELDRELGRAGRRYLLLGPGRWGTRDRWLGVPVTFPQIARARVIVEADLPDFRVDSSLGSHFFHNVTSMNIGYFTVPASGQSFVDWTWLASFHPERRTAHCAWTVLPEPLEVLMDGRRSKAIVRKRVAVESTAMAAAETGIEE
jgi:DNA-binding NarL/FixJ family response regulator